MSIDLHIEIESPFSTNIFKENTRDWLRRLLNFDSIPSVEIHRMDKGQTLLWTQTQIDNGVYVLSYAELKDQIVLIVSSEDKENGLPASVSFEVGKTRSATEYVLALAGALALADAYNLPIEDGALFWTKNLTSRPADLLNSLAITGNATSFEEACKKLLGNRLRKND